MVAKTDILEKAFILFAQKGFVETSTEDIASAVGLKKQSLYSHFKNKNEILIEILKQQLFFVVEIIDRRIKDIAAEPINIFFKEIFKSYIDIFADHNRLLLWKRVLLMIHNVEYQVIFNKDKWQFEKDLSKTLYEKIKQAQYQMDYHLFQGFFLSYMLLIQGYLDWMIIGKHDEGIFNTIWDNFWNGTKDLFK